MFLRKNKVRATAAARHEPNIELRGFDVLYFYILAVPLCCPSDMNFKITRCTYEHISKLNYSAHIKQLGVLGG